MEFYHLRSFVAVAQTGNLTQAAKRLYTTPPAVSAHIKTLEEELSTVLFTRSNKGMSLTDKGQLLLKKAQLTLNSAVDLVNFAATNQDELLGTFHLGINVSPQRIKLAELIENLQENCSGISLDIQQQSSGKILNEMRKHRLDGGYIFGDVPDDFFGIAITEQQMTTIAPLTFDCSKLLTQAELSNHHWIRMSGYCPFDTFLTEQLGKDIPSVLKTSDDGTRLALVKHGFGLSFLEKEEAVIAEKGGQIQMISTLDFNIKQHFVVAKDRMNEPLIKALMQEVRILWNIEL